ncbi:MAG: Bax inhibitor-1/YccA family protein [Anaerolineae bacterium]
MSFDNAFFGDRTLGPITYDRVQPILKWVYTWMGLGLLTTALVAFLTLNTPALLELATNRAVFFGAIIGEFVLVIALTWGLSKMSPGLAAAMFMLYAAVNGFTLSLIALIYTSSSIVAAAGTAAALFGVMSVFAFTTSIDLTKWGSYFMMALIGLVIAMVVNMFVQSGPFGLLISFVGVILFTGLTAYDTQKIKRLAENPQLQSDHSLAFRLSLVGALTLYLDFINLFLFLLRLMGRRR